MIPRFPGGTTQSGGEKGGFETRPYEGIQALVKSKLTGGTGRANEIAHLGEGAACKAHSVF